MELTKKEREKLIRKISRASGIAQYALAAKMDDEQLMEAANNLTILNLTKKANDYNRHCQRKKTEEANTKLKEFMSLENSEIVKTGKWLLNALSKGGKERGESLLEKNLVHKEDYNASIEDLKDVISEQKSSSEQNTINATETIQSLEKRISTLTKQQSLIKKYIINNYDSQVWKNIQLYFDKNSNIG